MNNLIGLILLSVSQASNSICDAMVFTQWKIGSKRDFYWHVLKYGPDRTMLFFAGVFFGPSILEYYKLVQVDFYHYAWHYTKSIVLFAAAVVFSVFLWHVVYKYFHRLFRRWI